jgi:hypothetical protein
LATAVVNVLKYLILEQEIFLLLVHNLFEKLSNADEHRILATECGKDCQHTTLHKFMKLSRDIFCELKSMGVPHLFVKCLKTMM